MHYLEVEVYGICKGLSLASMLSNKPSEETSTESAPEEWQAGTRPLLEEDVCGASLGGRTPNSLKIPELKQ